MITPFFLYGTAWKENETEACVSRALDAGFRAIDTANQRKHYFEAGVGAALKKSKLNREQLFLQTKFTFQRSQDQRLPYNPGDPLAQQVRQSFQSSLEHLQTDYIDSYILHGPTNFNGPSLTTEDWQAWSEMEALFTEGKIKNIGISNVNLSQLMELCTKAKIKPRFVQIRCYARNIWDREIRNYCNKQEIKYQGFSLLTANPQVLKDSRVLETAARFKATPAQIIFSFSRQIGMLPMTGTQNSIHMNEDLASQSIRLTDQELKMLEEIEL